MYCNLTFGLCFRQSKRSHSTNPRLTSKVLVDVGQLIRLEEAVATAYYRKIVVPEDEPGSSVSHNGCGRSRARILGVLPPVGLLLSPARGRWTRVAESRARVADVSRLLLEGRRGCALEDVTRWQGGKSHETSSPGTTTSRVWLVVLLLLLLVVLVIVQDFEIVRTRESAAAAAGYDGAGFLVRVTRMNNLEDGDNQ